MFTTANGTRRSLFSVLTYLVDSHPSAVMGRGMSRADRRRAEELMEAMPPHLRDDLGLSPTTPAKPEHPALVRARNRASRWGS